MSLKYIIRIDAFGQNNFALRFVGSPTAATKFHVRAGDEIRFVAYYNNTKIGYQISFKNPTRTPFTDVHLIDMPQGGLSDSLAVTTTLTGGMSFQVHIPSLGWEVDPEIIVEGATLDPNLKNLLDAMEKIIADLALHTLAVGNDFPINVTVTGSTISFDGPDPILAKAGDTISWQVTQNDADAPDFLINFSADAAPTSPLDGFEDGIGPDSHNAIHTAQVNTRFFRRLKNTEGASKDFWYRISMKTGAMPISDRRKITLTLV